MRRFLAQQLAKLKTISLLQLHFSEYGFDSSSYDFNYVCVADGRVIAGGRLAYSLLSPFALKKGVVTYPYGYGGLKEMQKALSAIR